MYFLKNFHISSRVYGAILATNERPPRSCMCPVLHGDRDKSLDEQVRRSRGVRGEFACDGDGMMDWRRRLISTQLNTLLGKPWALFRVLPQGRYSQSIFNIVKIW